MPLYVPRVDLATNGTPGYSAPDVVVPQGPQGPERQIGGDLAQAGSNLARADLRNQAQNDETRTSESFSLFADKVRKLWEDPKQGYRHTKGKGAVDGREGTLKAIQEARREQDSILQNDIQRREFAKLADQHTRTVLSHIDNHFVAESEKYDLGQTEASADQFARDAVTFFDPQDPRTGEMYRGGALRRVDEFAAKAGLAPAQRDALWLAKNTEVQAGRVEKLLAQGQSAAARAYLDSLPATEMDPGKAADLRRTVQRESDGDTAKALANAALTAARAAQAGPDGAAARPDLDALEAAAIAAVEQQFGAQPAAIVQSARALVEHEARTLRRLQDATDVRNLQEAQRLLLANPAATWHDLPAALKSDLDGAGLLPQVSEYSRTRQHETSLEKFVELDRRTDAEWIKTDPEKFIRDSWGKVSAAQMEAGLRKIAVARGNASPQDFSDSQFDDGVKVLAREVGVLPSDGRDPSKAQVAAYEQFLHSARNMRRLQGKNGDPEAVYQQLREGKLGEARNLYAMPYAERAQARATSSSGSDVPLQTVPVADLLAELEKENAAIRERNARRAPGERMESPHRTDLQAVADLWETQQQVAEERDLERGAAEIMAGAPRNFLQEGNQVRDYLGNTLSPDDLRAGRGSLSPGVAARVLGIPVEKLTEEMGYRRGNRHGGGDHVDVKALALYLARRERMVR